MHFDFDDFAGCEFVHHDREIFEVDGLRLFGDFAELLDNPPAHRLRVKVFRFVLVDIEFFEEVVKFRTAVHEVVFIVNLGEVVDHFVVFVPDLTDEFFEDIFERYYAERSAVLVHHDRHMYLLSLHTLEQCGYFHMLGCDRNGRNVVF